MCMRTARKKKLPLLGKFYGMFTSFLFKYDFKLLTSINLVHTPKKRLLMLVYQVEVTIFPKIFLQKTIYPFNFIYLHTCI